MVMTHMFKPLFVALCAATMLTACGGGGDDAPPPTVPATAEVPGSASASTDGLIAYLKELVASAADMLEPVDVAAVTPPGSEAAEPTPVD
jgi:hypothetical protein